MYRYDQYDHQIVQERVAQFRDQVRRRIANELTEDEFRILRLQNGLYMQRHAHMLRVAVPYGLLSSTQLRKFAFIARKYDRGYGHFTTRQNIQYNWINLEDTPDIFGRISQQSKCTRFRLQVTACAILPLMNSRVSPLTRSLIHVRMPKSCVT